MFGFLKMFDFKGKEKIQTFLLQTYSLSIAPLLENFLFLHFCLIKKGHLKLQSAFYSIVLTYVRVCTVLLNEFTCQKMPRFNFYSVYTTSTEWQLNFVSLKVIWSNLLEFIIELKMTRKDLWGPRPENLIQKLIFSAQT